MQMLEMHMQCKYLHTVVEILRLKNTFYFIISPVVYGFESSGMSQMIVVNISVVLQLSKKFNYDTTFKYINSNTYCYEIKNGNIHIFHEMETTKFKIISTTLRMTDSFTLHLRHFEEHQIFVNSQFQEL